MKTYIWEMDGIDTYFEVFEETTLVAAGYCTGKTYHAVYGVGAKQDVQQEIGMPVVSSVIKYKDCLPSVQRFIRQSWAYVRKNKKREEITVQYKSSPNYA